MTVTAIDSVVADVMRVAELKGLLDEFAGARHVRRTSEHHDQPYDTACDEKCTDNTDLCESVGAAVKDLRHRMLTVGSPA